MNNTDFLNVFEEKIRGRIIEFCTKINHSKADLYILMARKAACFINALEEYSLIAINGDVISERLLDTNIEWNNIRKVIIIDDVIISGTTLYRTIKSIKDINSFVEIKVFVLGINEKWFNSDLLKDEKGKSYLDLPIKPLDNSQCIKLSGDIVKMLAMMPTPYNIDYPIYNTIKLAEADYDKMLNMPGWEIHDASSHLQTINNIFTRTFVPNRKHLNYCGNFFLNDLINDSLIKIRIYGKSKKKRNKEMHSFSIVPMAILPPLKKEQIDSLFEHLASDKIHILSQTLISITSKLRFIQFVIADRLANIFIQEVDYYTGKSISIARKESSLRFLFPHNIINEVIEIADKQILDIDINYNKQEISLKEIEEIYSTDDFIGINSALISPFLQMYYQSEIPARSLAQKYGTDVFDKIEYNSHINRLNKGYSLLDLTNILKDYSNDIQKRIISAFLDRAIDNGIAVPITVIEGDIIYRAFRHGEDVQFGQRETRLCFEMFNAFNNQVKKSDWQKIWVEKLMVFFLKFGENRFLEPIQTDIANYKHISGNKKISIASVKYYLQGPVVTKVPVEKFKKNPCLDYSDKVNWLSRDLLLSRDSPLKQSSSGMFTFDKEVYQSSNNSDLEIVTDKDMIKSSAEIGYIFGLLIRNGIEKKIPYIDSDELVALSCCCEPKDAIGALAAEINLAKKVYEEHNYEYNVKNILIEINSGTISVNDGMKLVRRSPMYQAINDGQRKFNWYIRKYPYEIISRIENEFEDILLKNLWNSFWSPNLDWTEDSEDSEKIDLAKTEGFWLICANIYFLIIEYYFYFKDNDNEFCNKLFERIEEAFNSIESFAAHNKLRDIIPFVREFKIKRQNSSYMEELFDRTILKVDYLFSQAQSLVEKAEDFYKFHLRIPDINYYNSAIYIEVENEKSKKTIDNIFKSICFRITKSEKEVNAILKDLPVYDNIIKEQKGDWYIGCGGDAAFWLLQFVNEIINQLNNRDNYKIFYLPDLPNECAIKVVDKYNFTYNRFWELIAHFSTDIERTHFQNNLIYEIRDSKIKGTINSENKKFMNYELIDLEERMIRLPNSRKFNFSKNKNTMLPIKKRDANVGILTIVTEEAQAVLREFSFNGKASIKIDGRFFDEVNYKLDSQNEIKIVHLQSSNQGNIPIVNAYHALNQNYNLDYIVLLGIAGSIQEKIKICDVVIGTNVIYYEKRKESGIGKPERRGEVYNTSFDFTQIVNRFFINNSEPANLKSSEGSFGKNFDTYRSVIGSGEAVIADPMSDVKKWLLDVHGKTGVVETEAAGFCQAFQETQVVEDKKVKDIIIIRGISDHADYEKDDKWRLPSSRNAVIVLKRILNILYDA